MCGKRRILRKLDEKWKTWFSRFITLTVFDFPVTGKADSFVADNFENRLPFGFSF